MSPDRALATLGWCRFGQDAALHKWADATLPVAQTIASDPEHVSDWLRCGGTWFAGVNILPNDAWGAVASGPALAGEAISFLTSHYGPQRWDRAQISVIYPGYPQPMEGESAAAFRFRRDRDAAHVDGLLPVGPARCRHLHEPHSFVLGLPLNHSDGGASPMVVWEGSHRRMQSAFRDALKDVSPHDWPDVDLTDIYQATRRTCFETCKRVVVTAKPGEAYIIHRLTLHGVAPWQHDASAPPEGRIIAYFRPELTDLSDWLV